jgi:hypothetical protein
MTSVQRSLLENEANRLGFDSEYIKRTPTYAIEKMIEDSKNTNTDLNKNDNRKQLSQKSFKKTGTNTPSLETRSLTYQPDKDDDTVTVVDMSHVTNTKNPNDQKYQRFIFLVNAKNSISKAIEVNSKLLEANGDKLDADDKFIMKEDISKSQEHLKLLFIEMKELQVWFQEIHEIKKNFYEKLSGRVVDVSGNLVCHFTKKMENIDRYVRELHEESEM